ncbi:1-deoxy-D-xylulose-5-phosphate reductoisomerase [Desulfocurvibacter africanus]|uniref:1-deoxy-D-xylulose-5-phosphate reductoisomerase n=1 Tax=Desulfocurvibacter africanus TaxID=873 RepID=UPI000423EF6E|nr:1-deoxy-D-xylulose-5-phosphate reductoisomerase [Desulfocurvibacter africanus]
MQQYSNLSHSPQTVRLGQASREYISRLPATAAPFPRRLAILGSTGSIGVSALKICAAHPDKFQVLALAGGRNAKLLAEQAAAFRPAWLGVLDDDTAAELIDLLPSGYAPTVLVGESAYTSIAALDWADVVLSCIVGAAGLAPTLAAVRAGKIVALANKESLVLAGGIIRQACRESGAVILPVDSEHNALFQAVHADGLKPVRSLILTASGGPFRGWDKERLRSVTRAQALNHPNWSMGAKITIDSSTLMNKGLEFIEACHLFGMAPQDVRVIVHPQSIVHSLAEFVDGSLLAHMGPPDMRVAIAYCLGFPERLGTGLAPLDLIALGQLTFEAPDTQAFPCLRLAQEAFAAGPSHPVVLNAANEVAVDLFLRGRISYLDIPACIEAELSAHTSVTVDDLESILALDHEVRARTLAHWGERTEQG